MNILLAVISGIFLSIMITLNGLLNTHLSVYEVSFIVHLIGFVILTLYIILVKQQRIKILGAPAFLYFVGLLGVLLVSINSFCFNIIGVTLTVALSLSGQIIVSALVDNFGLFGVKKVHFHILRLPAFIIIGIGLTLMIRN